MKSGIKNVLVHALLASLLAATATMSIGCETGSSAVVEPEASAQVVEPRATKPMHPPESPGFVTVDVDPEKSSLGFVGSRSKVEHVRHFRRFSGDVVMQGEEVYSLRVDVDMASLLGGDESDGGSALLAHLISKDFFSVAKFPTASFATEEIVAIDGVDHTHQIKGVLKIRGEETLVDFPALLTVEDDAVRGEAVVHVDRRAFGMDHPSMQGDAIHDDVIIKISLFCPR